MDEGERHHSAALDGMLALVRLSTSAETARVVEGLIRARRGTSAASIDLRFVADAADNGDLEITRRRVDVASLAFCGVFGIRLVRRDPLAPIHDDEDDVEGNPPLHPKADGDRRAGVTLASAFVDLLDRSHPTIVAGDAPEPDAATASWIAIVAACPASGRGHHLVLRCLDLGPREPTDAARLVAARTRAQVFFCDASGDGLELAVLRAELHAGRDPAIVVMDREVAPDPARDDDDDDSWDRPVVAAVARGRRTALGDERFRLMRDVRNTYVWRGTSGLAVDPGLATVVGAAFGPVAPTRAWRDTVIARAASGIGAAGVQALAACVDDPRDADALGAMASVAVSALGLGPDEAAVLVAGSLSGTRPPAAETPGPFDARLVVCDEEGHLLLARAGELARHGGRVLFWGPPGGGKSTFAQALAAAMGRGARTVTGATILARHWGATERIIADVWSRAAADGATLIIDEVDSLCGVRDPGASNGNAYLVRTLTNEFLRAFDAFASVPVIATANHLEAIDDAVRRRFTFVIHVSGELTPDAEELAWRSLLGVERPAGWSPTAGANVSDFANAARRCRMLGLTDATSLAAAVERSRDARLGPRPQTVRSKGLLQ